MKLQNLESVLFATAVFVAVIFQFIPSFAQAESYDVYVDKQADSDGDGSEEKPYTSIADAIKHALENDEDERSIGVKKGVYEEALVIGEGIEIDGDGRGRTVISGKVRMEDGSELENLTVDTAANVGVSIENGEADVRISNVEIRGARRIGIDIAPGAGKLTFESLIIHKGKGKGIYVQRGHEIEIVDSKIYDNGEEGIDIRDDVTGKIRNNSVYENGEGGIELILGDSVLDIRGNNIFKNKASGISTQFYATAKSLGEVNIQENKISNNGKYGLHCGIPSGGNPIAGYWAKSVNLVKNVIEKNALEEINRFCKIIEAVDPHEEEDNSIKETVPDQGALFPPVEVTPSAVKLTEEDLTKERVIWDQVELLARNDEEREKKAGQIIEKMQHQNFLMKFFVGISTSELDIVREEAKKAQENIDALKSLLEQAKNVQSDTSIQDFINEEETEIKNWESFVQEQEGKWSFKKWLNRLGGE